jgi:hypothetical protein
MCQRRCLPFALAHPRSHEAQIRRAMVFHCAATHPTGMERARAARFRAAVGPRSSSILPSLKSMGQPMSGVSDRAEPRSTTARHAMCIRW